MWRQNIKNKHKNTPTCPNLSIWLGKLKNRTSEKTKVVLIEFWKFGTGQVEFLKFDSLSTRLVFCEKYRLLKGGTGRVPVLLGPCGTSIWYRHAACTKPVPMGQGKVKRDLSPVPGTGQIPTQEACPCPRDRLYTYDGACPSPTCPKLSHEVGLQDRANLTPFLGGLVFLERTRILSGIQFTRHFIEFVGVETKRS